MGLLINFDATEYAGTDFVKMQGSTDSELTWTDCTPLLALTVVGNTGSRSVTNSDNLEIDTSLFLPGYTYAFRLIDQDGFTISNIIYYTIPGGGETIASEDQVEVGGEDDSTIQG